MNPTDLANVLFALHIGFMLFFVGGMFIPPKFSRWVKFHAFVGFTTIGSWLIFGSCPLTLVEHNLRCMDYPPGYECTRVMPGFTVILFEKYLGIPIENWHVVVVMLLLCSIILWRLSKYSGEEIYYTFRGKTIPSEESDSQQPRVANRSPEGKRNNSRKDKRRRERQSRKRNR